MDLQTGSVEPPEVNSIRAMQQTASNQIDFNVTQSGNARSILAENGITFAGFPLPGERIIRVGQTFTIQWDSNLVPSTNILYFEMLFLEHTKIQ
jgi:hypothetical protein